MLLLESVYSVRFRDLQLNKQTPKLWGLEMQWFGIGLAGIFGVYCRYAIDEFVKGVPTFSQVYFPISTFAINALGSCLAGLIFGLSQNSNSLISPAWSLALLVGFCGGFTTFSAYSLQNYRLFAEGQITLGLINLCFGPILGLLATFAGVYIAQKIGGQL